MDLALFTHAQGRVDVVVAVQGDPHVRSALERAGVGRLRTDLTDEADGWEIADGTPLGLDDAIVVRADDVAVDDVSDRVAELVSVIGLGTRLLEVTATAVDGDPAAGLDVDVLLGVPEVAALIDGGFDLDQDRWAQAVARADDVVTAVVHLGLSTAPDVAAGTEGATPVDGEGGLAWEIEVGEPAHLAIRPARSARSGLVAFGLMGLAVGVALGAAATRRRRRARARGG